MLHPAISGLEARTQNIFSSLMWASSYPGQPQQLEGNGLKRFEMIGETLIDLETSYYSPDPVLARRLLFTGAHAYSPATARYHFYPVLSEDNIPALRDAPVGSYAYPDEGATIVVGCVSGQGQAVRLRGPGIPGETELQFAGLPAGFWQARAQAISYPLGWDLFLITEDALIGVPRSTIVEVR